MRDDEGGRRTERLARVAAGERRAQMYLGGLRWLEGFEAQDQAGGQVDGRWFVVGSEPAEIRVDGPALARARRAINRLRRDHAHALGRLVGDAAAWTALTDGILQWLSARVHGKASAQAQTTGELGDLAPARVRAAARALASSQPALRPLVRAATSAWVLRPDTLVAALAWMQPRARVLARLIDGGGALALRRALGLARLGAEGAAGVDALIALALADAADGEQTAAALANLIRRLGGLEVGPAPPPARSGVAVVPWIDRLLARDPEPRARALSLLAAVDVAAALEPARAWEGGHGDRVARAEALAGQLQATHRGPHPDDLAQVIAGVQRAKKELPSAIAVGQLLEEIDRLAGLEPARRGDGAPAGARRLSFHRAVLCVLPALPQAATPGLARVRFVGHAAAVAARTDGDPKAAWLWEALASERAAGAPEGIFGPWQSVLAGKAHAWLEEGLLESLRRPAEIRRLGAALARLVRDVPASEDHALHLAAALAAGLAVEDAVTLTRRLEPFDGEASVPLVRAAAALVGREVAALAAPLRAMLSLCGAAHGHASERDLAALCERVAASGQTWLILGLLARDGRRALELAELGRCVPARQWPRPAGAAATPTWIAAYPAGLGDALARLAAADPDAELTARRRLARDLPDRAALAREAATLRGRAPLGARESRRLANLEARIAGPRAPSPARLARLAVKLNATALEIGAARFATALTAAAQARLTGQLGIGAPPGWPHDRMQRSILRALIDLEPTARTLAGRLLQARSGPPPWDLREDPANRAFLDRVRARGVDPAPWLDDRPVVVAGGGAGGDNRPLELALCHDPLEVFAMGAHFDTCLAPEGGNFFSVVTNAADVNKRVLYARREGKVIGRCLLALTEAAQLLTFQPYCHDTQLGFEARVRDFAVDLAARMGSRVASTGRVATLLGRDWYDDGARDLVGQYPALEDRDFAELVNEISLDDVVPLITEKLGRPLDDVTLPVVVGLTALQKRPALIGPLVPHLLAFSTLPDETLAKAAELARRSGDLESADRLLLAPAMRADLRHGGAWYWGQVLARRRPSLALARLHETRPRGVHGWKHEQGERLAVAALALEQLHRRRQAAAFYRRSIADAPWLADEVRARIAALEASAEPR